MGASKPFLRNESRPRDGKVAARTIGDCGAIPARLFKLNLGCGRVFRADHINVDYEKGPGVDLILDLNSIPYPFRDESVSEIYASHLLEHLDNPFGILKEWHRFLRRGGKLELIVPHRRARGAYVVTHRSYFDEYSLSPIVSHSEASLEHRSLFNVVKFERHYTVLWSSKLTYHVHKRFPWARRFPLGRIWQLRWILEKL